MELANLKVVKGWQTTENRGAAIERPVEKSDEQISPGSIQVLKGRRLDVDEILKRSLPKLSRPTVLGV